MVETPGSEFELDAELVLLAMGFVHPVHEGMIQQLGVNLDPRGNVMIDANHMTSKEGVFAAGDMAIGQSLVVRATAKQGRKCRQRHRQISNGGNTTAMIPSFLVRWIQVFRFSPSACSLSSMRFLRFV